MHNSSLKTIFVLPGIFCMIVWGHQIGWGQSTSGKIKYEINSVFEFPRFTSTDVITESISSSVLSPEPFTSGGNFCIEIGMSYKFHDRQMLAGRLGAYLITTSAAILQIDPPIPVTMGPIITNHPIMYSNGSARLELSHRYLLYDEGNVQFSLNSGVGLRYWSWNQTSEVTYFDFAIDPNPIPIGKYTSSSIRPLHPDLNLGLAVVLREFFKNIDLSASYSYLWAPLDAYKMDSLTFRNGAGVENQFQFNNRVNFGQLRVGFIFSLGGDDTVD